MRHIIYSMQFKGKASPAGEEGVMKATTTATSCSIKTVVGNDGVEGSFIPAEGGMAFFESEVRMVGTDQFVETGTISFGDDHTLNFATVGHGTIGPGVDTNTMIGAVIWKVDGGEGQFEKASGYITSNFSVNAEGDVVDYHMGSIFLA